MAVTKNYAASCSRIRNIANNYDFINSYGCFQDYERDKNAVQATLEMRNIIKKYFSGGTSMFDFRFNQDEMFENDKIENTFAHIWKLLKATTSYSMRNKFHDILDVIINETDLDYKVYEKAYA